MSHAACCVVIQFTVRNDAPRTAAANFFTRCSPRTAPRDRYGRCSAIVLAPLAPATAIASFCNVPFVSAGPSDVLLTRSKIPATGGYRCHRVAPLQTRVAAALRALEIPNKASLVATPCRGIRNHHVSLVSQFIQRANLVCRRLTFDDIHRKLACAQFSLVVRREFPSYAAGFACEPKPLQELKP